jgi:hypothetical protein
MLRAEVLDQISPAHADGHGFGGRLSADVADQDDLLTHVRIPLPAKELVRPSIVVVFGFARIRL